MQKRVLLLNCNQCDKVFEEENEMKNYKNTVHREVSDRPKSDNNSTEKTEIRNNTGPFHTSNVICHECEQTFQDDGDLMNHIEVHHIRTLLESTFVNPSLL